MTYVLLNDTQFAAVNKQIESGLYVCKRVSHYLKKVVALQETHASEVLKVSRLEDQKSKAKGDDMMVKHVMAAVEVQDLTVKMAERIKLFAERTEKEVADPLEAFVKKTDEKRAKIMIREANLSQSVRDIRAKVSKERLACVKAFDECLEVKRELDTEESKDAQNGKKVETIRAKLLKLRQKTQKQVMKFEQLREQGIRQLDTFYTKDVPELMGALTELEVERMKMLRFYLDHFSKLQIEAMAPVPASDTLVDLVKKLDAENELKGVATQLAAAQPPSCAPLECELPCNSDVILTDQWFKGGDRPPAQSFAGVVGAQLKPAGSALPPQPAAAAPARASVVTGGDALAAVRNALFVRALFDYNSDVPGDLSFRAGDFIKVLDLGDGTGDVSKADFDDSGWWSGVHLSGGQRAVGRFPNNYSTRISGAELAEAQRLPGSDSVFDLSAAAGAPAKDGALSHPAGGTAVAAAAAAAAPAAARAPGGAPVMARALYAYAFEPTGDPAVDGLGYVTFSEGDLVEVTSQAEPEWWLGTVNGQVGYFPANCVELLPPK